MTQGNTFPLKKNSDLIATQVNRQCNSLPNALPSKAALSPPPQAQIHVHRDQWINSLYKKGQKVHSCPRSTNGSPSRGATQHTTSMLATRSKKAQWCSSLAAHSRVLTCSTLPPRQERNVHVGLILHNLQEQ